MTRSLGDFRIGDRVIIHQGENGIPNLDGARGTIERQSRRRSMEWVVKFDRPRTIHRNENPWSGAHVWTRELEHLGQ